MRTLPTNYAYTTLYNNGILAHYVSVLMYNAAGSASVDLTSLDGYDFVQQVTLSDNVDENGITAKISLQRDVYKRSFSPLNTYSKYNSGSPTVFVGRRVQILMASVPIDVAPQSSDFFLVADQHVDSMEFGKGTMELTCTDRIVALMRNTYIDTQRVYGSGFVAIESVMQGVVDDNINTPLGYTVGNGKIITIALPGGSPSFVLAAPTVQKQSVLDALTQLAGNIGWSLRSKWYATSSAFAMQFYAPSRSVASILFTFPPTVLDDITQATISKTDVRNYIYGFFTDSTNNNIRQKAIAQDATSITKYGDPPMKMELTEAATSAINTPTQMAALLANALSDLKDPVCMFQVQMPLFWPAEVSDAYKLTADGVIFDGDQSVGLTQLTHTFGKGAANTQMNLRGSLPGQYNRWFYCEARPGISPSANMLDPSGPSVSLGANVGQIVVNYTVADQTNWSTTEVYISGSTFSQPAQVGSKNVRPTVTLAAKGKQAHFTINALTPGGVYYVAVVVIDRDGNVGTMSAVQSVSTQQVGPYHENLASQQDQLIRNPDFCTYTLGTSMPPDNWNCDSNLTWSSSLADQTNSQTGQYCIFLASAGTTNTGTFYNAYVKAAVTALIGSYAQVALMYTNMIPLPSNEVVNSIFYLKGNWTGDFVIGIVAFDGNKAFLSCRLTPLYTGVPAAYGPVTLEPIIMDATARYIQVFFMLGGNSASGTGVYIDRSYSNRALAYCNGQIQQPTSPLPANTTKVLTAYFPNSHGVAATNGSTDYTVKYSGYYTALFYATFTNSSGAATATLTIKCNGVVIGNASIGSTTTANYMNVTAPMFSAVAGNIITFTWVNSAPTNTFTGQMAITQIYRADR